MGRWGTARARRKRLPPGPALPVPVQSYLLWRHWIPYLDWCRRRYGPVFTTRIVPTGTVVYIADPDDIKQVFTGDPRLLHAGAANDVLGGVLGDRSLLLLDGEDHLRERRLLLPPFHGQAVARYRETVREIADREIDRWPEGERLGLHPRMQAITLEVILRAVFGVTQRPRLEELRATLPRVVALDAVTLLRWVFPRLDRIGRWRRYRDLGLRVDRLLYDEIAERRRRGDLEERSDILSLLMCARYEDGGALPDAALRDELMTLLLAGHETTAASLAWAFERLMRHPDALGRVRAEIAAEEDRSAYLEAVVKETLRVRPVIADVVRRLTADAEIAGYSLPAGTVVSPAISVVQRAPEHYPDPLDFRPERFLDNAPPTYSWIPFGGGTRRCVGAAFATLEMKVVLWRVLERLELSPVDGADERIHVSHVTMVPHRGGEARVRRRPVREPALVGQD